MSDDLFGCLVIAKRGLIELEPHQLRVQVYNRRVTLPPRALVMII